MATVHSHPTVVLEVTEEELVTIREGLHSLRFNASGPLVPRATKLLNDTERDNWKPVNA
ncbi:hypothetical protein [Streptomyces ardesiacus]|uniref:hypothetical protein n=1 Tax=Streptomyces ardesiacus TaxID=285564 RepID=UPI00131F1AF1|nr:hypothetical protein [Streptomyces ardesiacus]